jgi:hypothetical protein
MNVLERIAQTRFVQKAIAEQADLSAFKKKPTLRIVAGIFAICLSYIIGWPAVTALGTISICLKEPLIVAIGGPLTYGLSHLVFIFGMYLAGAEYSKIFMRWATRVAVEKLIARTRKKEST